MSENKSPNDEPDPARPSETELVTNPHAVEPLRADSLQQFSAGDQVDDFQLISMLGSGAFAQVFLARQVSMERLVALKISSGQGSEPRTLAQLDHPNVVRVFDQRQHAEPPLNLLYMEVVSGGTLLDLVSKVKEATPSVRAGQILLDSVDENLQARGTMPPEDSSRRHWLKDAKWPMVVCQIGAQLASGLAYAHAKGVLHRDIKPANVLLTPEGLPKLADFNVSFNSARSDESPADAFGGSLAYMSPEQLQACHPSLGGSPELVREASDIYSLGVLLWELLCGTRPFESEPQAKGGELTRVQLMVDCRHYADFSKLTKQLPKECPESLRQVLLRCLQPRIEERYQSADEVAKALDLCLHPQSWKLLQESSSPLIRLPLQFPILTLIIAGLTPNALAGYFNLIYNYERIVAHFPDHLERFMTVQQWVNSIMFPLGASVGTWIVVRTRRTLKHAKSAEAEAGSNQLLLFGLAVSLLTLSLWTLSGIIFPIAINIGLPLNDSLGFYSHFFLSLALCGIVAMAYPYFLLTSLTVRVYFPALVRNKIVAGPRWRTLQRIRMLNRTYLMLTALVPMLSVLLAVAFDSEQKWALMVASGGGIIGFAVMFALERYIEKNLDALERIAIDAPQTI
ncbi:MAG: serine/threonine protein kinase [Planctomycetes bacterium]|nr:serine/threonine protein kinase [Planctomycetota bacterium]